MMSEKLDLENQQSLPFKLDGDIYPLDWSNLKPYPEPLLSIPLPPIDQTIHAFSVVKFYLGQIYHLFNEDFEEQIRHFYERRVAGEMIHSRMWFVQLLLVLAFGRAFSSRARTEDSPPGSKMFISAMSIMPNQTFTGKDSLTVIENLALISLYLYAIDHREGAHSHVRDNVWGIGQKIMITQTSLTKFNCIDWSGYTTCTTRGTPYSTSRG